MFVITVKSKFKTKKSKFLLLCVCLTVFVFAALVLMPAVSLPKDTAYYDSIGEYSLRAESQAEIENFAFQFSLKLSELYTQKIVTIPYEFNHTYNKYNELQKKHGLDLSKYKGKECVLCMYSLKDEKKYLSIVVYKGRVIGGHLSTLEQDSTMYTFSGE